VTRTPGPWQVWWWKTDGLRFSPPLVPSHRRAPYFLPNAVDVEARDEGGTR